MRIEWDQAKNRLNRAKHGLSFNEASRLFRTGVAFLEIYDVEHSIDEDRFLAIGPIARGIIVVAYTEREDDAVRIVSARMATPRERRLYEERMGRAK